MEKNSQIKTRQMPFMKQIAKFSSRQYFPLYGIRITCSIWYFIQFVCIAIFMSLHAPAGAGIPVASASPIHVLPIKPILKSIVVHTNIVYIYIYTHTRNPKQS